VHADFRPGNVFVSDRKVKLLDFGIARAVKARTDDGGTRFDAGSLHALTPAYASPEMLLDQATDPRDDVYALACVSYELMTGRHPFNGVPALSAMHDGMKVKRIKGMGRYQYKALLHGLAFRQQDRTPTVEAFLDEIAGPFGVRGRALRRAVFPMVGTAPLVGGSGCLERNAAASTSSAGVFARMTPAGRKSASTAASEPASAAVCDWVARAPAPVRPPLRARIGLRRATRRARRPNFHGLPNDSR